MDCKRCGYAESHREHVRLCVQGGQAAGRSSVTAPVTSVTAPVTKPAPVTAPVTSHPCPDCGAVHTVKQYVSGAEKQRAYRARK